MKIKTITYDEIQVKSILSNLRNAREPITYTEHFISQITKRKISADKIDHLILFNHPLKIKKIENHHSRFEFTYSLNDSSDVEVIADVFNNDSLILISAFVKMKNVSGFEFGRIDSTVEMENIYDSAFDLMSISFADAFRYGLSIIFDNGFYMDFDIYGSPVSIELIQASDKFMLKPDVLFSAKIEGMVEITDDIIKVALTAHVNMGKIRTRVVEGEVANTCRIPSGEFQLLITNSV